jgi:lysyl-tRNA synthetase class 1
MSHWARHAARMLAERSEPPVCASGITPSGEFHLGHLREILSAEMIHRACDLEETGIKSRYIFIVDSMDPLRRVYDFLSPSYEQYIGHPLAYIPAPNINGEPGDGSVSYARHFLEPFREALEEIGVECEVVMNHEVYETGKFADYIHMALEDERGEKKIRKIIEEESGRDLPEEWWPYNPIGSDGSMDGVKVLDYDPKERLVHWEDSQGRPGTSDINKAEGKLPWRIDWAARWIIHGITCEPAGKDHGAAGGSYDTGIPICKVLGGDPPEKMVYEWIQLKGMGPMSSSSGVTIGPVEALEIVPPEILRYLIARTRMNRHIDFDTGEKLFEIADEYEKMREYVDLTSDMEIERRDEMSARKYEIYDKDKDAIELSKVNPDDETSYEIGTVSFRHLAMLAQIKTVDEDVWDSLGRSGHIDGKPSRRLIERLSRMRSWVSGSHFPEGSRIVIQTEIEDEARASLSDEHSGFLSVLTGALADCEWGDEAIIACIRETADEVGISKREAYVALYWVLLGRDHGPRVASIIAEMSRGDFLALIGGA